MCSRKLSAILLLLTFHLSLFTSHAAPPDHREIWVPITQLKSVLEKNPRAVLLTKEQYDTLLRDSGANNPTPDKPPVQAIIQSADYTSQPEGKALRTTGKLSIEVLTDGWTLVPLQLDVNQIARFEFDGTTAVRTADTGLQLVVRGKGRHTVVFETVNLVTSSDGVNVSQFSLPATSAGTLKIVLPPGVTAPGMLVHPFPDRTEILHAFAGPAENYLVKWNPAEPSGGVIGSVNQNATYLYQINSSGIYTDFDITASATMGRMPDTLRLPVPKNCKITEVRGADVTSWTVNESVLTIQLARSGKESTSFHILADSPLPDTVAQRTFVAQIASSKITTDPPTSITSSVINQPIFSTRSGWAELPFLAIENARRISGVFGIISGQDTAIRSIYPGGVSRPAASVFDVSVEHNPHFAGAWHFESAPDAIRAQIVPLSPAFNADIDTAINFQQDGIHLDRTITLHERDGEIFTLSLHLPAGEELLGVQNAENAEANYRQEGDLLVVTLENSKVVQLKTRVEPAGWPILPETGTIFSPAPVVIDNIGKVSGYLAVNADPSFHLETVAQDSLEPRDGRITPVKGDFAWFGRGAAAPATLKLRVTRSPADISAQVAGYARPAANTLEVNARIDFKIARSGVRTLRVKIPGAENFYLDGPDIAERTLGGEQPGAKDIWTITFQKEQTGAYGLQVTGQIPMTRDNAEDKKNAGRFQVTMPTIEPLDAPRFGSTWAVEANTDTEIRFESRGLNELDNLRAPQVAGYTPLHRVIAVFGSLGTGGTLILHGERHIAATLPSVIVDRLDLTSILSTSGHTRHQVTLTARNAGDQFLEVGLPSGAKLWSVTIAGEPVKPVESGPDSVRISLPQKNPEIPLNLGLVYETGGREWSGSGSQDLMAPRLSRSIPILQSKWTVWLPQGQSYERLTSNLSHQDEPAEDLLLARLWSGIYSPAIYQRISHPIPLEAGSFVSAEPMPSSSTQPVDTSSLSNKLNTIIIPQIEFRDASIRESIDYLKAKSRDLDPTGQGVNIVLNGGQTDAASTPITLSLRNVPMIEALKYITNLANLKYQIEPSAVTIVPLSTATEDLITKQYEMDSLRDANRGGSKIAARISAKDFLISQGVPFPPGSNAIFRGGALIVTNTRSALDLIGSLVSVDHQNSSGTPLNKAGLLPLALELEPVGKPVVFQGPYAAENVQITHLDWWSRGRRMWMWLVLGGVMFVTVGSRKPLWSLLWGMLLFTFIPVCLSRAWTLECNALLAGWIAAFAGVLVYRWCQPSSRVRLTKMQRSEA